MNATTELQQSADMSAKPRSRRHYRRLRHHRHGWWWKTLVAGLVLWVVTVVVTGVTQNSNLIPTLILVGSFLVPFSVVEFVIERVTGSISTLQLILAFFVGGIFGVLGASLLEADLSRSVWVYGLVGLVEELVKGILLVIFGWSVTPKTAKQGALLGATIGAGFAAFESAGYAFNAALAPGGIDLTSLLQTEIVRAVLAPVGHVLWTAILGAVLFGVAQGRERFRWSWWIPVAYLAAAALHALWDSSSELASALAVLLNGRAIEQLEAGFLLARTAAAVSATTTLLYIAAIVIVSVLGIVTLTFTLRHYRTRLRASSTKESL